VARSIQSLLRESKNFILVNTLAQFSASTIAVQGTIVSDSNGQESELMRVNITLIFPRLTHLWLRRHQPMKSPHIVAGYIAQCLCVLFDIMLLDIQPARQRTIAT